MTNRILDRSTPNVTRRNSELPFNFALKQQRAFVTELEQDLLELERRFTSNQCALCFAQQALNNATPTTDSASEPCTYDDFGLVEGLDLDVSWM